jgi:hypothetical protein
VPSHVPAQVPGGPLQGLRPTGAPVTATHVPTLPACAQVSHCPVQSLLQHTLSTHCPVPHSRFRVQPVPGVNRGLQRPAARSQKLPAPHCTSVAQPLHFVPTQTLWPQLVGVDIGHAPALQNAAGVTWFVAALHEGARH